MHNHNVQVPHTFHTHILSVPPVKLLYMNRLMRKSLSNFLVNTSVHSGSIIETKLVNGEYTTAGVELAAERKK